MPCTKDYKRQPSCTTGVSPGYSTTGGCRVHRPIRVRVRVIDVGSRLQLVGLPPQVSEQVGSALVSGHGDGGGHLNGTYTSGQGLLGLVNIPDAALQLHSNLGHADTGLVVQGPLCVGVQLCLNLQAVKFLLHVFREERGSLSEQGIPVLKITTLACC